MLIELVATLVLVGLVMVMAFPNLPQGTTPARFRALLARTTALLRDARSAALAHATDSAATFDRRSRTLRAGAYEVAIPADVDLALTAGSGCGASRDTAAIVFRADGTSCGGVLRFARGGRAFRVRVNWVTGHVEIVDGG